MSILERVRALEEQELRQAWGEYRRLLLSKTPNPAKLRDAAQRCGRDVAGLAADLEALAHHQRLTAELQALGTPEALERVVAEADARHEAAIEAQRAAQAAADETRWAASAARDAYAKRERLADKLAAAEAAHRWLFTPDAGPEPGGG